MKECIAMELSKIFRISPQEQRFFSQNFKISNMPKHLEKGNFEEHLFETFVTEKYIRNMSVLIAYDVYRNSEDTERLKNLLQIVFNKLKAHPKDNIRRDAGETMCEIRQRVDGYLKRLKSATCNEYS